ncbi:MAG: ABC transporter substrate-binding protein [Candidatus Izemoplasma sp.]|nr:ABC transporter substrate-binding protein [Candidatus Izemoplasma sp.]
MITPKTTLKELIDSYPELQPTLEVHGIKGTDNPHILKQIGDKTLEELMTLKNKNVSVFIELLEEQIKDESIDVTLQEGSTNGTIDLLGLLPCPVRVPLLEGLNNLPHFEQVNHELKAAAEGLDWLKDSVKNATDEHDLADIYISAGFDLFFEEDLMKQYKNKNVFKDYYHDVPFNKDFHNDAISLKDPQGDYSMIGVVPAVFLVNTKELGDRPMPKTWQDILDPIFKGSISLPVSDFDLFNAIMIHLYKEFGEGAIETLGEQLVESMHPSQMVKSASRSRVKPAISIMPYFFTKMALPGSVMQAVWPEDGAIISPIFMLTKTEKEETLKPYTDYFQSQEVGEILAHKGLFPSTHKDVDNKLDNPTFKWIGWDYINNNDIGATLNHCTKLFERGMAKNGSHHS